MSEFLNVFCIKIRFFNKKRKPRNRVFQIKEEVTVFHPYGKRKRQIIAQRKSNSVQSNGTRQNNS